MKTQLRLKKKKVRSSGLSDAICSGNYYIFTGTKLIATAETDSGIYVLTPICTSVPIRNGTDGYVSAAVWNSRGAVLFFSAARYFIVRIRFTERCGKWKRCLCFRHKKAIGLKWQIQFHCDDDANIPSKFSPFDSTLCWCTLVLRVSKLTLQAEMQTFFSEFLQIQLETLPSESF